MKAIVYSLPTSVDCQMAKRFFSENGIKFEDKNVEEPEFRDELVKEHHSLTLPTIVIGDEVILGFGINKERIVEKLNSGREVSRDENHNFYKKYDYRINDPIGCGFRSDKCGTRNHNLCGR